MALQHAARGADWGDHPISKPILKPLYRLRFGNGALLGKYGEAILRPRPVRGWTTLRTSVSFRLFLTCLIARCTGRAPLPSGLRVRKIALESRFRPCQSEQATLFQLRVLRVVVGLEGYLICQVWESQQGAYLHSEYLSDTF